MGQKVHPYGFRVGYNKDWHSHWFAKQEFATFLAEDLKLKRELKRKFGGGGVSHIDIERVLLHVSRSLSIRRGRVSSSAERALRSKNSVRTSRERLAARF